MKRVILIVATLCVPVLCGGCEATIFGRGIRIGEALQKESVELAAKSEQSQNLAMMGLSQSRDSLRSKN